MSSSAPATVPGHNGSGLYRIGEVSRIANVKAFVLRYWEGEFPMLQPVKDDSGHRLYRQEEAVSLNVCIEYLQCLSQSQFPKSN